MHAYKDAKGENGDRKRMVRVCEMERKRDREKSGRPRASEEE